MNIIKVTPRGYCKGVVSAIEIAKKTRLENPDTKITMLGMIVHNSYVVEALKQYKIDYVDDIKKTRLELLDNIDEGIVLITAHGASEKVYKKAKEKNLTIVDATCNDVIKTQNIIKEAIKTKEVIYIGKKYHPESEAIVSIDDKIHLVTSKEDIDNLIIKTPIFVTNQTTMSILEINDLIDYILKKFDNVEVSKEICNATRIRQEAILKLENIDVLFVVGDNKSNNSNKLKEIGLSNNIKEVYLINNSNEIKEYMIKDKNNIAITSGASTPNYLTNEVINTLDEYNKTKKLIKKEIEIDKIIY